MSESLAGDMKIRLVSIDTLIEDPDNARVKHNVEAIALSLERFKQRKPIVVDESGVVRAGNGTLRAARDVLGWTHIWITPAEDLTPEELTAYAIADNKTTDLSEFDDQIVAAALQKLPENLRDATGWTPEEFEMLLTRLSDEDAEATGIAQRTDVLGDVEYRLIVVCTSEQHQRELLSRLEKEGLSCSVLMS